VGYTKNTFGAASFFIQRDDGNNMLIDPPDAHPELIGKLQALGGVKYLLFTHKDHCANHEKWHAATGAPRLMHKADMLYTASKYSPFPVTSMFEMQLALGPSESIFFDGCEDMRIIATPGHTPGGVCFLYQDKFLFTGDVLANSPAKGHLHAHRVQCWQDWSILTESIRQLQKYRFLWILPGHGDWRHFSTFDEAGTGIHQCVSWMETQRNGHTPLMLYLLWAMLRGRKNRLVYWLADNYVMPRAAKNQFPNPTLPSAVIWSMSLAPALGLVTWWLWQPLLARKLKLW